jgi:hypothetical protein
LPAGIAKVAGVREDEGEGSAMGLFDYFSPKKRKERALWARRDKMSRIEYLLDLRHEHLEAPHEAWDGLTFAELTEQQLAEGKLDLAMSNFAGQVADCFEIAVLYWGQGDLNRAEVYLRKALERHERRCAAAAEQARSPNMKHHAAEAYVKAAAVLLDTPLEGGAQLSDFEPGYEPWFNTLLLDCCLGTHDFDLGAWQAAEDAWLKQRFPKTKLKEFEVYVKALTGGFASDADMLAAHAKMFTGRAGMNYQGGLIDGYTDNDLMIDYVFAAILTRIGWKGTYRHSWPGTGPVGAAAVTRQASHRHLKLIAPPLPAPDRATGVIADAQAARRFIDAHVKDQRDKWESKFHDPVRPGKQASKVAKALKELGWMADPATLDLMRTYRMDAILNDSTHIFLSDPIGDRFVGMKNWTQLLADEFGLHPDFIAVAESEEKADYRDPQGAWYVYWKKDRRIYAVQREEWDRPQVATANARIGKEVWPSYVSFVAWWVGEHLAAEG